MSTHEHDSEEEFDEASPSGLQASKMDGRSLLSAPRKRAPGGGAKKGSWVWDFFIEAPQKKAKCIVENQPGSTCGKELFRNTKTLADHLERCHPAKGRQFAQLKEAALQQKTKQKQHSSSVQQTLPVAFQKLESLKQEKYAATFPKQISINRDIALLFGTTNLPYYWLEMPQFEKLIHDLDSKIQMPTRVKLESLLSKEYASLKQALKDALESGKKVTLCADFWSRKVTSFAGVTAHFWNRREKKVEHMLLGLPHVDYPHTATRVKLAVDTVLREWGIEGVEDTRVQVILTDNGSNCIAAFKDCIELIEVVQEETAAGVPQLFWGLEQEMDEYEDEKEFEQREMDHNQQFGERKKRLPCIDHMLACVLKNCFEKDPEV